MDTFVNRWGEGLKWKDQHDEGPHEANFLKLDCSKLKSMFGWSPRWNLEMAIEKTVEWTKCWCSGGNVRNCMDITSYNLDEIAELISYAARQKVNIKLLDLFAVEGTPEEFKHVSISEIKSEIMKKFRLRESDFIRENDYLTTEVMGIKVMIPSRIYSVDCQYNCKMYPCAEGIFGIRVYEDYSCAKCLSGTIYRGGLVDFDSNIAQLRKELNSMRFSY